MFEAARLCTEFKASLGYMSSPYVHGLPPSKRQLLFKNINKGCRPGSEEQPCPHRSLWVQVPALWKEHTYWLAHPFPFVCLPAFLFTASAHARHTGWLSHLPYLSRRLKNLSLIKKNKHQVKFCKSVTDTANENTFCGEKNRNWYTIPAQNTATLNVLQVTISLTQTLRYLHS